MKQWRQWLTIFLGSKITADGDCSHEIKRCLLLGRKVMINLDSILKNRDITLSTKDRLVKAMVFPVVMCGCESCTIKKAECRKADVFELWCWRLLRVPWTMRRSNLSILKEISPGSSLVGLKLELKLQYFDHHMQRDDSFEKKDWGKKEKGTTDDEMVGWHHQHNGHGFGWILGVGDEQGGLACCGSWGHKELDTTEQLKWTKRKNTMHINTFILTSFMTLMHWRYFFPNGKSPPWPACCPWSQRCAYCSGLSRDLAFSLSLEDWMCFSIFSRSTDCALWKNKNQAVFR